MRSSSARTATCRPTRPSCKEQLDAHDLPVLAGTVFSAPAPARLLGLHVWKQVTDVAALTQAVGGEHIVVIPERLAATTRPVSRWRTAT